MIEDGKDVHLVIDGVHDGRARLVGSMIAFRPTGRGRPEGATRALIEGERVAIAEVKASRLSPGAFEARILG